MERILSKKKTTLLDGNCAFSIEVQIPEFAEPPYNDVTVIRPKFDRWLGKKAEEAGVMILTAVVDDFVFEEKTKNVAGIKSGEDEIKVKLVIIAEGANHILTEKLGLAPKSSPRAYAIGIKETYQLSSNEIEQRFNLKGNEGLSNEILGNSEGIPGGGFLYTNKESISFGIVLNMEKLTKKKLKAYELFEKYKKHPYFQQILRGAKLIEYSAYTIPEGGFKHMAKLYGNGVMVTGDAAGMLLNAGLYLEGMNSALDSGRIAAQAATKILEGNDYSAKSAALYEKMLRQSFVYKDLKNFKRAPKFLEIERIFTFYPKLINDAMYKILKNTGKPRKRIVKTLISHVLKTGSIFSYIGAVIGGWRSI